MKIYIHRVPATNLNEIYIVQEPDHFRHGDIIQFFHFKEDGEAIVNSKVHESGTALVEKPTMVLHEQETRELLQAFADMVKERGVESRTESYSKGKLEATEQHLQDMRRMVFDQPKRDPRKSLTSN